MRVQAADHPLGIKHPGRRAQNSTHGRHGQPLGNEQPHDLPPSQTQSRQNAELLGPIVDTQTKQKADEQNSRRHDEETESDKQGLERRGPARCRQTLLLDGLKNEAHRRRVELQDFTYLFGRNTRFRLCVTFFRNSQRGRFTKAVPPQASPLGQRDKRLGRGPVLGPILLVFRVDAACIEGEGRVPVGHRGLVGDALHLGNQIAIGRRTAHAHHRRQPKLLCFFLVGYRVGVWLEIRKFDCIAGLGAQAPGRPLVQNYLAIL